MSRTELALLAFVRSSITVNKVRKKVFFFFPVICTRSLIKILKRCPQTIATQLTLYA